MKLNYFSKQTMPQLTSGGRASQPSISFGKAGVIRISPAACKMIGLSDGDKITVCQDDDIPENFYVFKDADHGFEARLGSDKKSLVFNHATLRTALLEAVGRDSSITQRFLIAGSPTVMTGDKAKTQYWGILINS